MLLRCKGFDLEQLQPARASLEDASLHLASFSQVLACSQVLPSVCASIDPSIRPPSSAHSTHEGFTFGPSVQFVSCSPSQSSAQSSAQESRLIGIVGGCWGVGGCRPRGPHLLAIPQNAPIQNAPKYPQNDQKCRKMTKNAPK